MSQVAVSSRGLAMRQPNSFGNTSIKAERIFLLSPANIGGIRGSGLMSGLIQSDLGLRLRNQGAPLGEVFSFISAFTFGASWHTREHLRWLRPASLVPLLLRRVEV